MKLLSFFIFIMAALCSCGQDTCDLSNLSSVNWQVADSTTSYCICKTSSKKLVPTDSVSISFIGTLNNQNLVAKSVIDSLVCTQLIDIDFATYSVTDEKLKKGFEGVMKKLFKNSELYVKYQKDTTALYSKPANHCISLFFKISFDSSRAVRWLDGLTSSSYIDSLRFTSNSEALKALGNEGDWKSVLDINPLPSFAKLYIKAIYCNQKSLDSLKSIFLKNKFIEEVTLPDLTIDKTINEFRTMFRTPYILKFRT